MIDPWSVEHASLPVLVEGDLDPTRAVFSRERERMNAATAPVRRRPGTDEQHSTDWGRPRIDGSGHREGLQKYTGPFVIGVQPKNRIDPD